MRSGLLSAAIFTPTWDHRMSRGSPEIRCAPRLEEEENKRNYYSAPLSELRKEYTSEAQKKFLEEQIVAKQAGEAHPQATQIKCAVDVHSMQIKCAVGA